MSDWWGFLLLGLLLPLALNEAGDIGGWLACVVLTWGAKRLGAPERTERYTEEWLADLERVPGKLTKLMFALSVVTWSVPRLRWQFAQRRRTERLIAELSTVAEQSSWDQAACRSEDADMWFAESRADQVMAAKLCGQCPLKAQCLAGAVARREPWGVWGGALFERGVALEIVSPE